MSSDVIQIAQLGWAVVQALMTAAVAVFTWFVARERIRKTEFETLRKDHDARIRRLETVFVKVETGLDHLPRHEDYANLATTLASVRAAVEAIDRRTGRIEDFLQRGKP